MAQKWSKPQFSRGEVDAAGKKLRDYFMEDDEATTNHALAVINNWRACHSYPLLSMRMTLTQRARRIDARAIVAQRLKRLWSIAVKLGRNENMALSQTQDIGGCRAVVRTVGQVEKLVRVYERAVVKSPNRGAEFSKKYDYIQHPKKDGYRSVHLIFKYRSSSRALKVWNGLRIEIQLRSRMQHAWATAVETVDTFTRQAIKTGGGKAEWRKFFLLMGSAIAIMERRPVCPGYPGSVIILRQEIKDFVTTQNVRGILRGWSKAMTVIPSITTKDAAVYLLYLDATEGNETIKVTGFSSHKEAKASETYLSTEKAIKDKPNLQAVLVSSQSLQSLRSAFPNYFADTEVFIDAIDQAVVLKAEDVASSSLVSAQPTLFGARQ